MSRTAMGETAGGASMQSSHVCDPPGGMAQPAGSWPSHRELAKRPQLHT